MSRSKTIDEQNSELSQILGIKEKAMSSSKLLKSNNFKSIDNQY